LNPETRNIMFMNKPFPVPVVAYGPGSQPDDDPIDFMPMPREMSTYRAPSLPEPQALAAHEGALEVLHQVLGALQRVAEAAVDPIELGHLRDADRNLLNQVLGEGEVAAQVTGANGIQAQESVFAGVWRVVYRDAGVVVRDTLEVGAFPRAVAAAARADGRSIPPLPSVRPADTMNAPAVLAELRERTLAWRSGDPAHVVNLSLLPLSGGDSELFERQLGRGGVLVLSRGYGNCRIANTRAAGVWRVTYFNSQDMIILDTLEVGDVPEVACAARQDLEDSAERLREVLQWVEAS
jgi:hydrogenase-1 operon protein HyaF